ncbi:hypothetical protein J7J08_00235 [Stenotrophomonas sp. ISL-67]|uniref:hypothetical protein n=1 Tax=Stenotrophomonas sp. ISL-67 TaxID=2819171 RepID=UPI001BE5FF3A|nr:hypothetical protein [Stenotrophomonas sp. ISL-67]MBT2766071.1 hypothetical protein [Stenotrophomonas sp. ISL-67]
MHAHPFPRSLLRTAWLLLPAALLSACGGHKEVAKSTPPVTDKVVEIKPAERDGRGAYRFHMTNGEKRMTADEFDAWMKANGIRVAKGNPNAAPAAKPVVVASKGEAKGKKKKK